MDVYKYVNRLDRALTIGIYSFPAFGGITSSSTIPELDAVDGIFVDKYLNGVAVPPANEFNTIHIAIDDTKPSSIIFKGSGNEGWHDLLSPTTLSPSSSIQFNPFRDNIYEYQFGVSEDSFHGYHIPHDYLPNSDMYIHVHWAHNAASQPVGGSTVTWRIEATYAKGYSRDQFVSQVTADIVAPFESRYTHVISEIPITGPGLLDKSTIETDGLLKVRLSLLSNSTTATVEVKPFMFFCDLHYQSRGLPTPNKNYPFLNEN